MFRFSAAMFFIGALAVIVPLILHFLKKRPSDKILFPSFYFLRMINASAKNKFNDIRKWLILILRILAILFLCAAFALPFIPEFPEGISEAAVIMVDASMSMKSRNSSSYIDMALEQLDALPLDAVAAICAVGDIPLWSGGLTAKKDELRAFIKNNCISDTSSSYNPPLKQADALLKKIKIAKKNLILITDMHKLPWAGMKPSLPLSPDVNFKILIPGKKAVSIKNVWIEDAKAYPGETDASFKAVITVVNGSPENVSGILSVSAGKEKASRISVTLGPLEKNTFALDFRVSGTDKSNTGIAELNIPDELHSDNVFYFPVSGRKMLSVLLSAPDKNRTDFVRAALRPDSRFSCAEISYWDNSTAAEQFGNVDLFIMREALSLDVSLVENIIKPAVETGKMGLVVCREKSQAMNDILKSFGIDVVKHGGKAVKTVNFGDVDFDIPPFRIFMETRAGNLFDVNFYNVPRLKAPDDANIIASFSNGWPAVMELTYGKGTVYVLAFGTDRNSSDWPVRATFLPFWQELVKQFKVKNKEQDTVAASFKAFPAKNLKIVRNLGEDDNEAPLMRNGSFIPSRAGSYYLETADGVGRLICVNHAPSESLIAYMPDTFKPCVEAAGDSSGDKTKDDTPQNEEHGSELFLWCLLLALICGGGELLLSNRTAL